MIYWGKPFIVYGSAIKDHISDNVIKIKAVIEQRTGDWRDGLGVKSTGSSCRRPRFSSQHLQGSSQPFLGPVPVAETQGSGLLMYLACTWYTDRLAGTACAQKINLKNDP